MIYNNVTNILRHWCDTMTERYRADYEQDRISNGTGLHYLPRLVTSELWYKLGTLVDRNFPNYDTYRNAVLELMTFHIDFVLMRQLGNVERYYVETAETAFLEYLNTLTPDMSGPTLPYYRVIGGSEAEIVANRFWENWGYDTNYWFPLNGESGENKLFLAPQWVKPHWDSICRLLGVPAAHVYEYGEAVYDRPHCAEVDELSFYAGSEIAYCPRDFSWIIYFSHENTVTFAGTILPQIKEILRCEEAHWNRFDWSN